VREKRNVILKLGGSVITNKGSIMFPLDGKKIWNSAQKFFRRAVVKRICLEIKDSLPNLGYLILVHGAGVFGHFPVSKFLEADTKQQELVGWPLTSYSVLVENIMFMDEMLSAGIPAISIPPRSLFTITKRDESHSWVGNEALFDSERIRKLIPRYVPILFGDLAFDRDGNAAVLSGDTILYLCARELGDVDLVACGTDVGGIFTDDPKKNPHAKLIDRIALSEKSVLSPKESSNRDVDGGMSRKFGELMSIAKLGIPSMVIDASKEGNISKVLRGEHVGTLIVP
jgi:isopentenyl phosphate kinase